MASQRAAKKPAAKKKAAKKSAKTHGAGGGPPKKKGLVLERLGLSSTMRSTAASGCSSRVPKALLSACITASIHT